MKRQILHKLIALVAVVGTVFVASVGVPVSAAFAAEKPILGDMQVDNEAPVQWVRDALMRFHRATGRWPQGMAEVVAASRAYPQPIDMTAFETVQYSFGTREGVAVALFEFTMAGSGAKGAFAVSFVDVK